MFLNTLNFIPVGSSFWEGFSIAKLIFEDKEKKL